MSLDFSFEEKAKLIAQKVQEVRDDVVWTVLITEIQNEPSDKIFGFFKTDNTSKYLTFQLNQTEVTLFAQKLDDEVQNSMGKLRRERLRQIILEQKEILSWKDGEIRELEAQNENFKKDLFQLEEKVFLLNEKY